jgi:hypothetical protein
LNGNNIKNSYILNTYILLLTHLTMSISAFNIELNSHFIVKYNNKTRIVIPFKALNDGYLVYENNKVKRFKLSKMQRPSEDDVISVTYNYDFETNENKVSYSDNETESDEEMKEVQLPETYVIYQRRSDVSIDLPIQITYYAKTRVVVPTKLLEHGFLATEEGKMKHFKFDKIEVTENQTPLSWNPWEMRTTETQIIDEDPAYSTPKRTREVPIPSAPKKIKLL